jgi:ATP-dependent Clp protease ATP-binding subunit ClpA
MTQRSEQADWVLHLAKEEADLLGHRYLGPEHLVLGVLRDGGSGASQILEANGVN